MILAKFNGIPKTTHSSRVTTPATSSGNRVRRTSATRRNVITSSTAIAASAKSPASIKARVTVLPASSIITAGPVAVGSTANTAVTKSRSPPVSSGSALGSTCTRARPSGANHALFRSAGMLCAVTR